MPTRALCRWMVARHRFQLLRIGLPVLHRLPCPMHLFEFRQFLQSELPALQLPLSIHGDLRQTARVLREFPLRAVQHRNRTEWPRDLSRGDLHSPSPLVRLLWTDCIV
jgi:hypothetical protein